MDVVIACAICIGIDLQMSDPLENSYEMVHLNLYFIYVYVHVSMQQQFVRTVECSLFIRCLVAIMYSTLHVQ